MTGQSIVVVVLLHLDKVLTAITVDWGSTGGLFTDAITVIETNAAGCTDTVTLDVFISVPSVTPVGPFCEGEACVVLDGSPLGGVWSGTGVVVEWWCI